MILEYLENLVSYVLVASFCLLVFIGLLLNVFIAIINLNCWKIPQRLQAIDMIITSLAVVRIILLFFYTLFVINTLSGQSVVQMNMFPEYGITLSLLVEFSSLWWGSVLCVFYCVKITNYSNRLFIRLKQNISKMVPWLLLVSLVPSVLSTLPYIWFVFSIRYFNGTHGQIGIIKTNWLNYFIFRFAGSIIPFVISCITIGLLVVSLLRHTRNLGSSGSGFSDTQCDTHLNIIRNMISFLLLYVVYFVGANLSPLTILIGNQILTLMCFNFYVAFPSLHSVFILVSNRELKNAFVTILRCSWLRDRARSR